MKKDTVTISFDQEKLKAIQFYAGKNDSSLEAELDEFMAKLYKKYVPAQTREYIESMATQERAVSHPARRISRATGSAALSTEEEGA